MTQLWPRLPGAVATARLEALRSSEVADLGRAAETTHPAQLYAATGGSRVEPRQISTLRESTIDVAIGFGFPDRLADPVAFDRRVAPVVADQMSITSVEATHPGIWSFLALITLPDITHWRFGFENRERWVASDLSRHMFSRLWWQAFLLTEAHHGTRDSRILEELSESDLNQLLERPRLAGNRAVVRQLAAAVIAVPTTTAPRRALIRESAIRIRRDMAFIDYASLSSEQLSTTVARHVDGSARSLSSELEGRASRPPAPTKSRQVSRPVPALEHDSQFTEQSTKGD